MSEQSPRLRAPSCVALAVWLLLCSSAALAHQKPSPLQERLGYPANARLLIIHADDFGMSHSVDRAIAKALENGWVTSASVMVPCPWFPEVVHWAGQHPHADLGLHLVLNSEWSGFRWGPVAPIDRVSSLLDSTGYFYDDPSLFASTGFTRRSVNIGRPLGLAIAIVIILGFAALDVFAILTAAS